MRISRKCKECNKPFSIDEGEQKFLKNNSLELFTRCSECRKRRKSVEEKRKCKDCGNTFSISENEQKFLKDNGLELFVRCSECRKQRREEKCKNGSISQPFTVQEDVK